jgi:hypothetical protein
LSGTDVDYVKFVIKPNKHKSVLVLWFGYAAFSPHPPSGIIRASATFNQTKLLGPDGIEIGLDSRGKKHNGTTWRWFRVVGQGGEYEDAFTEEAALFDQIVNSACIIPYPEQLGPLQIEGIRRWHSVRLLFALFSVNE